MEEKALTDFLSKFDCNVTLANGVAKVKASVPIASLLSMNTPAKPATLPAKPKPALDLNVMVDFVTKLNGTLDVKAGMMNVTLDIPMAGLASLITKLL